MILNILLKMVLSGIALYYIVTAGMKYYRREHSATSFKFLSTVAIWGTILVVTLMPSIIRSINTVFGFGENLNTLIFIGFVITYMLIFKIITIIEHNEQALTEIVRKDALRNIKRVETK